MRLIIETPRIGYLSDRPSAGAFVHQFPIAVLEPQLEYPLHERNGIVREQAVDMPGRQSDAMCNECNVQCRIPKLPFDHTGDAFPVQPLPIRSASDPSAAANCVVQQIDDGVDHLCARPGTQFIMIRCKRLYDACGKDRRVGRPWHPHDAIDSCVSPHRRYQFLVQTDSHEVKRFDEIELGRTGGRQHHQIARIHHELVACHANQAGSTKRNNYEQVRHTVDHAAPHRKTTALELQDLDRAESMQARCSAERIAFPKLDLDCSAEHAEHRPAPGVDRIAGVRSICGNDCTHGSEGES